MLSLPDAYELVRANRFIAGTSKNAHDFPNLEPVKHFYDLDEDEWVKASPPFVVWVPGRDDFDANTPQEVRLTVQGKKRSYQAPERVQAGVDINIFVTRTADLDCHRELFKLVCRVRLALREALDTTANYRTDGGGSGGKPSRTRWPSMLHYVMRIAPYIPVVYEPYVLALIEGTEVEQIEGEVP
jgi:hypothetical protein